MSRLTERFGQNATTKEPCYIPAGIGKQEGNSLNEIVNKLGRLEDLADEGRLIELPCKVGDAVYEILPPCNDILLCEIFQRLRISRCINKECDHYIQIKQFRIELLRDLGHTVFLTKAEAEARLAEVKGGEL